MEELNRPIPHLINLKELVEEISEEEVLKILESFTCKYNDDVDFFLKSKAIEFSKRGFATTYLIFLKYKQKMCLVGYFAIAMKTINIYNFSKFSSNYKRKISSFCTYDAKLKQHVLPLHLIGQLGKNYNAPAEVLKLISRGELLDLAIDRVRYIQSLSSGRFVYLECEDVESLVRFYESKGFVVFDKRYLDKDEKSLFDKKYLVQLIKFLK